ncbi:phytoene/squalene synthase family protein [Rhodopseudomonas palustris]|uniref:phytoene/squalene synthase family protein n=1 Tax=Rhodopseudomonas palustris TaxID=1076 RepID=UPI000E5B9A3E|nr:phytoene/squalene synthase family protein [Rhodopseudomonas palustris]QLH71885.1 squalene/phytoene synthase family protein [Rhodopseudomonas palustris]RIA03812.1 squalene/phytoene synthase family protein [Rhodopseudomonas palustris]
MSEPAASTSAAAFCAGLVREANFDRYAATLFVPPEKRRSLLALAAFNAEIVRVRSQVSQPLPGEVRLQWWTDLLAGTAHGGAEGNPVAAELTRAIAEHALPVEPLTRLIEAHIFDLYNDPMPDWTVLEPHLVETEGALISLTARVLAQGAGQASDAVEHVARHAGVVVGVARIVARLPYDSARRQLYLPNDVLQRHGCDLEQVFSGQSTAALRAALTEVVAEARKHLDQAFQELIELPAAVRPAFLPLGLARCDLNRLAGPERDPFTPFERSRLATLWTLWRASRSKPFR